MAYTVRHLIETVYEQFQAAPLVYGHGTDNAWDEAVACVVGVTEVADDQASLDESVAAQDAARVLAVADERVTSRQPLPYLLGRCQYMGHVFRVRPGVIVPRSPIGTLLESALNPWLPERVNRVLDLCAGSGCLGIVAAHRFKQAHVTLIDIDPAACDLARENVALHELEQRVSVVEGDVRRCGELLNERFDLVLANPPYVSAVDMQTLPAEFRAEPALALAAGEEGLDVMAEIFNCLPELLNPGGVMVGEIGRSTQALQYALPDLPLIWLDLPAGGEGVFLLEGDALTYHTAST